MSQYGYDQGNKKKNEVTESMISTISEAFEFEDFLGEKTTLKDRVPKNKANLDKKIVHFIREVNEDRGSVVNTLPSYNQSTASQKRNTFENYMSDDFFDQLRQKEKVSAPSKPVFQQYQSPTYTSTQPKQYDAPKHNDYSSTGYSYTPSTSSPYSSSPVTPDYKNSYKQEPQYPSTNKYESNYQPQYKKTEYPVKNQYQSSVQNTYNKSYSSSNINYQNSQPKPYGQSQQSYPQINFNKSSVSGQNNDWSYKPSGTGSSGTYSVNSGYNTNSNPQPNYSQTYTYKPYEPPAQKLNYNSQASNNTFSDRNYDTYGDYAKDFSSPDIMAILNKRKKP